MYYVLLILTLLILHVLASSVLGFLNPVSYVLIVYIAVLEKQDETNYIWHAVLFGLFSDFIRGGYLGPGVLIYFFYGVLTIKAGVFFDMQKFLSRFFFRLGLVAVHVFLNMAMNDYLKTPFISAYLYYLLINTLALAALVLITEVTGAFKGAERRSSGIL